MKKLFFSLFILSLAYGCEKDDSQSNDSEIIGKWFLVSSNTKYYIDNEFNGEWNDSSDVLTEYYQFNSDGSFEYYSKFKDEEESESVNGTFSTEDNTLTISKDSLSRTLDYEINQKVKLALYDEYSREGYDYEYTAIYEKE